MDIYGIIGDPVEHSLSPVMHKAAFKKQGIDAEYRKIRVERNQLEDFFNNKPIEYTKGKFIKIEELSGFNITIPHKVKAKEILEKKFPNASSGSDVALSGAVNTVKRVGDKLEYTNTDVSGFGGSLDKDLKFVKSEREGSSVFILGCGGAARAIIADLEKSVVHKIYVYDIDKDAVDSAEKHFSRPRKIEFISKDEIGDRIKDSKLLVNATPVGMKEGDPSPVDKKLLREAREVVNEDLYVYDVVYNRETQLVKDAKSVGAQAVIGDGMLAWQGALAFNCWTGKKAADVIGVMRKVLKRKLFWINFRRKIASLIPGVFKKKT